MPICIVQFKKISIHTPRQVSENSKGVGGGSLNLLHNNFKESICMKHNQRGCGREDGGGGGRVVKKDLKQQENNEKWPVVGACSSFIFLSHYSKLPVLVGKNLQVARASLQRG